jgi:hypothetical protein
MELRRAYRVAVAGKHRDNNCDGAFSARVTNRRPLIAAAVLLLSSVFGSGSHAQSGPFAGMAGNWAGGGTVSLEDGATERIRCRASYAVAGPQMSLRLVCASDSYRFDLRGDVVAEGDGAISGDWSESSRGVSGNLQGRGGNGGFQVIASAAGFNASISLTTRGNRQSITMRADSQFRGASISLSR